MNELEARIVALEATVAALVESQTNLLAMFIQHVQGDNARDAIRTEIFKEQVKIAATTNDKLAAHADSLENDRDPADYWKQ